MVREQRVDRRTCRSNSVRHALNRRQIRSARCATSLPLPARRSALKTDCCLIKRRVDELDTDAMHALQFLYRFTTSADDANRFAASRLEGDASDRKRSERSVDDGEACCKRRGVAGENHSGLRRGAIGRELRRIIIVY